MKFSGRYANLRLVPIEVMLCFFLHGLCVLQENRKDGEVFDLLYTLENISEIRDFELNCFFSNSKILAPEINLQLQNLVDLCEKIPQLEKKGFKEVNFGGVAVFAITYLLFFYRKPFWKKIGKIVNLKNNDFWVMNKNEYCTNSKSTNNNSCF